MIENWADGAAITPKASKHSALRARLGIGDQFVVCYSGNLGRAHEFDTFLGAADALRNDSSVLFLMIGGGVKMEALRRAVAARKLPNFRFLPYQPRVDLADSLAAGDLHLVSLLPRLEGLVMPSKLYGILAAGRPMIFIGDSDGEIARLIRDVQCGVSVEVNAGAKLIATILRLKSDPTICAAMGNRARECFLSSYTLDNVLERWTTVLDLRPDRHAAAALPREPLN